MVVNNIHSVQFVESNNQIKSAHWAIENVPKLKC